MVAVVAGANFAIAMLAHFAKAHLMSHARF
jgi:hypothetical protein